MPARDAIRTFKVPILNGSIGSKRGIMLLEPNVCFREETKEMSMTANAEGFRMPSGVRKSLMQEPAGRRQLWGFVFRGVPAPVANVRAQCCQRVEKVAFRPGRGAWRHSEAHMRFR